MAADGGLVPAAQAKPAWRAAASNTLRIWVRGSGPSGSSAQSKQDRIGFCFGDCWMPAAGDRDGRLLATTARCHSGSPVKTGADCRSRGDHDHHVCRHWGQVSTGHATTTSRSVIKEPVVKQGASDSPESDTASRAGSRAPRPPGCDGLFRRTLDRGAVH